MSILNVSREPASWPSAGPVDTFKIYTLLTPYILLGSQPCLSQANLHPPPHYPRAAEYIGGSKFQSFKTLSGPAALPACRGVYMGVQNFVLNSKLCLEFKTLSGPPRARDANQLKKHAPLVFCPDYGCGT